MAMHNVIIHSTNKFIKIDFTENKIKIINKQKSNKQ